MHRIKPILMITSTGHWTKPGQIALPHVCLPYMSSRSPSQLAHGQIHARVTGCITQGKTSGDDAKLGAGDDPEDALPSDYIQFSRLIGEAPSEAEQRLSRKQRMALGKQPDPEASAYLQK